MSQNDTSRKLSDISQGYIKEATYQFSDIYLPGKSSNSWGRGGQTKRDTLTDGMQLYIDTGGVIKELD